MIDVCIILYTCDYEYIILYIYILYIYIYVISYVQYVHLRFYFPADLLRPTTSTFEALALREWNCQGPTSFRCPARNPALSKCRSWNLGWPMPMFFFWCHHCNWVCVKKCFLLSVLSSFLAGAPWCWRGVPVVSLPSVPENDSLSPQILWHSILGEG